MLNIPVEIEADGVNLRNLITSLDIKYPGIKEHLVEDDKLRPGMSAVIDGKTTCLLYTSDAADE